ncbi:LOB domain-containing protein 38 [Amborella trichopoda]|uniref:LOB domain-containing protein n=1 Tax=Amborella trichopoda TaxID=13333 RepID=W1NDW0_AMBTC|nr:LOB domain-containing protein 38 [Amborella trichopoda]XP_011620653.1 LOB domain-containing protein 38 [Amborella trichopoda]ERM93932.1 hypothetical protein AMTR_s00137p00087340 [Amborella trichopoda]|eukprot:XP_006826695.1 LOB domain-containing protein 38 [Amborella trichopoda]
MSCNGCRVLRKGCSEGCMLRSCLQWIDGAEAQGHATVFVAKFFGRAGLMSFISAVPENQRPALFQSLLYEACGRTVNPVNGAVGLLWSGNWHVCQAAVEVVLRGGTLRPLPEFLAGNIPGNLHYPDDFSEVSTAKDKRVCPKSKEKDEVSESGEVDLCLGLSHPSTFWPGKRPEKSRPSTPSMNSEGSVTCNESGSQLLNEPRVLNLFV